MYRQATFPGAVVRQKCRKCYFSDLELFAAYHYLMSRSVKNVSRDKPLLVRASSGIAMHVENTAPSELTHLKVFFSLINPFCKP